MSTCAFPFGGNGNLITVSITLRSLPLSLHVPSRLEGMETLTHTEFLGCGRVLSLHVPSRLEGMETNLRFPV